MNIKRKLLAVVVAAVAVLGTGGVAYAAGPAAGPAAGTVPVVYAAHVDGWHGYARPGVFYFGQGGSPFITALRWTSWGAGSAQGYGSLWTAQPGCYPLYKCPYHSRYIAVRLAVVHEHGKTPYYAQMTVRFYYGGAWRQVTGRFPYYYPGGRVPVWRFPAVWPYL